ncbi:MAG: SDR family NAD(P)-dependent oxidoreductase [Gammaproteobacteria bacterium]
MFSLAGKTTVVTGGGRGIGKGICRQMARAGANVVIAGRTPETLEATRAECEALGVGALAVPADVTRLVDIERIARAALERFGYIDCWVNNAGGGEAEDYGPLLEMTEAQWDAIVDLNLKAAFFGCQAAARAMTRGGSIINITSRSGNTPAPATGQYGAAKAGLQSLSATMAVEWGHRNIRVNCVAPGVVPTETSEWIGKESARKRQIETIPLRRLGSVDEMGAICVFFASDEASWVSGQVLQAHGGNPSAASLQRYLYHINAQMDGREEKRPIR